MSKCVICGKPTKNHGYFCVDCNETINKDTDWVKALIQSERIERNYARRKVGGAIEYSPAVDSQYSFSASSDIDDDDYSSNQWLSINLFLRDKTMLLSERNTLQVYVNLFEKLKREPTSTECAEELSQIENRNISPTAYRKRKSRALQSLQDYKLKLDRMSNVTNEK